jgi:hypothetical protein
MTSGYAYVLESMSFINIHISVNNPFHNLLFQDRDYREKMRQQELCEMEEGFFNNRLQTTVQQAKLERSNPYRTPLEGKTIKQILRPICPTQQDIE